MVKMINLDVCDVVLGNRMRTRGELVAGGTPKWTYFTGKLSTRLARFILGQEVGGFHFWFRAYSREVLDAISYHQNHDDFAFCQEVLIQASHLGIRLGDVPVPVRYSPEASSIGVCKSSVDVEAILMSLMSLLLHKSGLLFDGPFPQQPGFSRAVCDRAPVRRETE